MSYLLNLIWGAPVEIFYLDTESTEIKKTTQYEYKNILNKEKVIQFNFVNITLDFDFDVDLFPNIESLCFDTVNFKTLSSYAFITKCNKLNKLSFKNSNLKYLSALINGSNINLKSLKIDTSDMVDDVDLSQLTTLEDLTILNSKLTRIGDLEKLTNLRILNLENNYLVKLNGIEKLVNIKKLNISNNILVSIDEIKNLKDLEEISFANNQIKILWDIEKTPKITKLIAISNEISNFNDLIKLKNLVEFNIKSNPVKSLPNLLLLTYLDYDLVKIDWNLINYIDGMKGFGLIKNIIKNLN
jgi:hypothetical protein